MTSASTWSTVLSPYSRVSFLVVEFSQALGQGQLMSVALVDPEGELPRRELSGEHAACEGSGGGFLAGFAGDRIEGEAEFVECFGKQVVDVVVRLGARAGGEDSKAGGVESGDQRIAGGIHHVARADFPMLQRAAWSWRAIAAASVDVTHP